MKEAKNCIFMTFDDGYFRYAKVALNSLRENFPEHPPIKVLYTGNSIEVIAFIDAIPNCSQIEVPDALYDYSQYNLGVIGSSMVYVRFILWSDYFDEYDTIMYIDCDTIIQQGFSELFELERFFVVSDNAPYEPENVFAPREKHNPLLMKRLREDGLDFEVVQNSMINSGVFVLPRSFRTIEQYELLKSLLRRYNDFIVHSDQSIITLWCLVNGIVPSRDFRYNFQTQHILTDAVVEIALNDIKIMHFSNFKPDKNFEELLAASYFIQKAYADFNKYRRTKSEHLLEEKQ